jgi:hypothetical protein
MADVKSKVSLLRSIFEPSTWLAVLVTAALLINAVSLIYWISTEPLRATRYQPFSGLFFSTPDNLFAGNDSDQDSDREAPEPTKVADKTAARSGKRDAPKEAPVEPQGDNAARGGRGGRRGGARGSEGGQCLVLPTSPVFRLHRELTETI